VPTGVSNVGLYTPTTGIYTNVTVTVNGSYAGGVLLPNGNVLMIPNNSSSNVATLNPTAFTVSNVAGFTSGSTYFGGVALPDGRVVFAGTQGTVIQIYNYITNSFSSTISSPILNGSIYGPGATLVPDGRVIFAPRNTTSGSVGVLDTMSPAPREFCLHPFFIQA